MVGVAGLEPGVVVLLFGVAKRSGELGDAPKQIVLRGLGAGDGVTRLIGEAEQGL